MLIPVCGSWEGSFSSSPRGPLCRAAHGLASPRVSDPCEENGQRGRRSEGRRRKRKKVLETIALFIT